MIYIAGPFFNDNEREILTRVESVLRNRGFEVFSPREHEVRDEEPGSGNWCTKVFELDRKAIEECETVVAVYHGNYSDSGTAWECGFAYGLGKKLIVVHCGNDANLMVHVSADANITIDELETIDLKCIPEKKYGGISF